jgi:hypothetical protein
MKPPRRSLRRISEKLGLRVRLGWWFATRFEDTPARAGCRVSFSQCGEDLISIDIEGRELEILRTFDFERHRPVVICAETLEFASSPSGRKNRDLLAFLKTRGFRAYADTRINTIFVDQRRMPLE